jgi:hypothetical protein
MNHRARQIPALRPVEIIGHIPQPVGPRASIAQAERIIVDVRLTGTRVPDYHSYVRVHRIFNIAQRLNAKAER